MLEAGDVASMSRGGAEKNSGVEFLQFLLLRSDDGRGKRPDASRDFLCCYNAWLVNASSLVFPVSCKVPLSPSKSAVAMQREKKKVEKQENAKNLSCQLVGV